MKRTLLFFLLMIWCCSCIKEIVPAPALTAENVRSKIIGDWEVTETEATHYDTKGDIVHISRDLELDADKYTFEADSVNIRFTVNGTYRYIKLPYTVVPEDELVAVHILLPHLNLDFKLRYIVSAMEHVSMTWTWEYINSGYVVVSGNTSTTVSTAKEVGFMKLKKL